MQLVQSVFDEGVLVEEAMWQEVVLLSKEENEYRGIVLVEVM